MGQKASKAAAKATAKTVQSAPPPPAARVNRNSSGSPASASFSRADAGIVQDGRDPQLLANASKLGQVAITRPRTPFEAEQPGVLQLRRQAQAAAEDPSMPNRVSARALQTVLYAHFSGRQGPDVDTLLREMNLNRTTFDTLASHLTAFDFLDQEIKTPGKDNARPLKRAVWPSPELTATKARLVKEAAIPKQLPPDP